MSETPETPQPEEQTPAPAGKRSRVWLQVLLGLAILVCGMLIGSGATILVGRRIILNPSARQPAQVGKAIAGRMSKRLNLTPEQQKQVREIIRQHMERVNEIRDDGREEIQQQLDLMRDDVAKALTPEQAEQWRKDFERLRHFAPQGPPRGGRPEGPGGHGGPREWGPGPGPGGPPPGHP